jgi:hypothetical protein
MSRLRRIVGRLLFASLPLLAAGRARAGNDDGILVGGQAALTGGAITAIASDGAAAWYNPAGLARITRQAFDINASAYGMSLITAKNLFTVPGGETTTAKVIDWQLIPTALSYSRLLSERVIGSFGVFIPYTTDVDVRARIEQPDGTRWTFGLDQVRHEYDYIASLGIRLSDTFRVGVALHGIYVSVEDVVQLAVGVPGAMDRPFQSASQHETRAEYGARLGVGVQWTPHEQLELGLSVQTPTLTGFRRIERDLVAGASLGAMQSAFQSEHVDRLDKPWDLSTPLLVRVGAAYRVGRAQLLLDGSASSPLDAVGSSLDRRLNGNVRLGALVTQSDRLSYGGGVFSDRNGFRESYASFLGVAGGVRIASNYTISEGPRKLSFVTTLAGRYAFGRGSTEGTFFVSEVQSRPTNASLRVHELAFNLGGGVTF